MLCWISLLYHLACPSVSHPQNNNLGKTKCGNFRFLHHSNRSHELWNRMRTSFSGRVGSNNRNAQRRGLGLGISFGFPPNSCYWLWFNNKMHCFHDNSDSFHLNRCSFGLYGQNKTKKKIIWIIAEGNWCFLHQSLRFTSQKKYRTPNHIKRLKLNRSTHRLNKRQPKIHITTRIKIMICIALF